MYLADEARVKEFVISIHSATEVAELSKAVIHTRLVIVRIPLHFPLSPTSIPLQPRKKIA